jgi:SOS-response transcriptional repressor LexA
LLRSFRTWLELVNVTVAVEGVAMAEAEDRLRKTLRTGRGVTPFVGTGVSLAATGGTPCAGWKGLLEAGIESCESAIPKFRDDGRGNLMKQRLETADLDDYLAIGTEISNRLKGVGEGRDFDTWIENTAGMLKATEEGQKLVRAVRKLGSVILTTNYDSLLEDVEPKWKSYDWKDKEFPTAVMGSEVVLHLHGSVKRPASIVLGSAEYQQLENELTTVLTKSFFITRTLVFIGCGDGLGDPHIAPVLKFMTRVLQNEHIEHFILVTREDHRKLSEHPISTRVAPITYGDAHNELRPFLEKLAAPRETAVIAEPEMGEQSMPVQEETGLLFVAITAERSLQRALQGLDSVKAVLQEVESDGAVPRNMTDWKLEERIKEHKRLAEKLEESAANLDTLAAQAIMLVDDAYNSTWQLTQPDYADDAGELTQTLAAISALETTSGQLAARIAEARNDVVPRVKIYHGYQSPSDHLLRAHTAITKAHARATSLGEGLGLSKASQETSREQTTPPVTLVQDTGPSTDDVPTTASATLRLAPMLGEARGGSPSGVGQANEDQIPVPPRYSHRENVYAVKVVGNSMEDYGVLDGDYVTILKDERYQDGDMVVAIFGGESSAGAVVKVLRLPDGEDPYLEPLDPNEVVETEGFEVQGKVVGLVRWNIKRVPQRRKRPPRQPSV